MSAAIFYWIGVLVVVVAATAAATLIAILYFPFPITRARLWGRG